MKLRFFLTVTLAAVQLLFGPLARAAEGDGDAAWLELSKATKPPAPPAEWNQKRPTAEQMAQWQKGLIPVAEDIAAKAKKFQELYPTHPKVEDAKKVEKRFLGQAQAFKKASEPKVEKPAAAAEPDDEFRVAHDEAVKAIRARMRDGQLAFADELEKQGRQLAEKFPKRDEPWEMLMTATNYLPPAMTSALLKEIQEKAPAQRIRDAAAAQLEKVSAVGKPFEMAFTAVDGRKVDLAALKGKVVLLDFWATWCGPCVADLPKVKAAYDKLHAKGFEMIGISLDEDEKALKRFVEKNQMEWPQHFDGKGWKNELATKHGISSIPAMYLVDKKGVLRDMAAREDMEKKVTELLAE